MNYKTTITSGVRINDYLLAEVIAAKREEFNHPKDKDETRYRSKILSISKTVNPF